MQSPEATLAHVIMQLLRSMGRSGGLSLTAASTLSRICSDGPLRLTDLSTGEGVAQPSMTQLINRLERDGYVRRSPSEHDRRVVLVEATEDGRALLEQRRRDQHAVIAAAFDQLSAKDKAAITRAEPALLRLAEAATDNPRETDEK